MFRSLWLAFSSGKRHGSHCDGCACFLWQVARRLAAGLGIYPSLEEGDNSRCGFTMAPSISLTEAAATTTGSRSGCWTHFRRSSRDRHPVSGAAKSGAHGGPTNSAEGLRERTARSVARREGSPEDLRTAILDENLESVPGMLQDRAANCHGGSNELITGTRAGTGGKRYLGPTRNLLDRSHSCSRHSCSKLTALLKVQAIRFTAQTPQISWVDVDRAALGRTGSTSEGPHWMRFAPPSAGRRSRCLFRRCSPVTIVRAPAWKRTGNTPEAISRIRAESPSGHGDPLEKTVRQNRGRSSPAPDHTREWRNAFITVPSNVRAA